ncbi:pectinesterase family protein [Sphingomonas donggukensis]|uniref:Pectinesterase family protein n=1 Tax=Sphingomonas donggukensis TaxID=2949093 RepID=A0ABY4TUX8_9SPHN|nr:pectinesterase family protein [Sphingomonas donggukensis]URW74376.1 pectinesterase family protein [Sphingomonas donggukensis]
MASLSAAINMARQLGRPATIRLTAGVWREKPVVDVPDLTIVGDGATSVLTFGAAAGLRRPDGTRWGTGGSATLTVAAPGVTLRNLTIRNDFDYLSDLSSGASGGAQAVALSLAAGADRSVVRDCAIEGYQDTLYVREGRAWFEDCRILGGTDFIFGGAAARFEDCTIVSRAIPGPIAGFVAAPSTPAVQPVGLVFHRCRLERERGLADGTVFLGRPWRAGGNMALTGAAAFIDCRMDAHIARSGWTAMGYTAPDGRRTELTPQEARLVEHGSRGPGAAPAADTRRMIDRAAAAALLQATDITNWRPRG